MRMPTAASSTAAASDGFIGATVSLQWQPAEGYALAAVVNRSPAETLFILAFSADTLAQARCLRLGVNHRLADDFPLKSCAYQFFSFTKYGDFM